MRILIAFWNLNIIITNKFWEFLYLRKKIMTLKKSLPNSNFFINILRFKKSLITKTIYIVNIKEDTTLSLLSKLYYNIS